MNKMSQQGIDKLSQWEGEVTVNGMHMPYDDKGGKVVNYGDPVNGFLTIGHGHLLTRDELTSEFVWLNGVATQYWHGLTDEQAGVLLDQDLDWAERAVNNGVQVPLKQGQFEALVSFTFNVGAGAFGSSTLLKRVNANDFDDVPNQFKRWNRTGGHVSQGLINRRQHEIDYWNAA